LDDFDDALIPRGVGMLLGVVFALIVLLASAHIIRISFVHFLKVVTRERNKRFDSHIITDRTEKGKKKKERKRPAKDDDDVNEASTRWKKKTTTTTTTSK
jgi:hypothetical protein